MAGGSLLDLCAMFIGAGTENRGSTRVQEMVESMDGIGDDSRVKMTDVRSWKILK